MVANVCLTPATGTAERDAAHLLLDASAAAGSTVGGDKNFDVAAFVAAVRALAITPHVAQKAVGTASLSERGGPIGVSDKRGRFQRMALKYAQTSSAGAAASLCRGSRKPHVVLCEHRKEERL